MTNEERLQKIIAAFTPFLYSQIDLKKEIKNRYIAIEFKDNFYHDLCKAWSSLETTSTYNGLFVSIKTGKDILALLKI